ncbi:MAG: hypothetical protein PHR16_16040 [Methylovulum sp.]|nr:hypothetical protein [Methylovulum sp.]
MSGNKDRINLAQLQKNPVSSPAELFNDSSNCALHAHTRQAEQVLQALKAQKDSQGNVKPKETKK